MRLGIRSQASIRSDTLISLDVGPGTESVVFGVIHADGLLPGQYPPGFDGTLAALAGNRAGELSEAEDAIRRASRDMLRHGRYKPTGRGKPASEYLLRAAAQSSFPRISPPVDICNLISLENLVPASIWDRDLGVPPYRGRRGRSGESYVFNAGGQVIGLEDLLLVSHGVEDAPMVNPVKDSHATKTHAASTRVGAVVYFPEAGDLDRQAICERFVQLLESCGPRVDAGYRLFGGRP